MEDGLWTRQCEFEATISSKSVWISRMCVGELWSWTFNCRCNLLQANPLLFETAYRFGREVEEEEALDEVYGICSSVP